MERIHFLLSFVLISLVVPPATATAVNYDITIPPDTLPTPISTENTHTITSGQTITWDSMFVMPYHEVSIDSGGKLIVTDTVYTKPETIIIVKPGGKLEIDNGAFIGMCHWKGIEVWGNPTQSQSLANQGFVYIKNGGTIKNALCGVQTIKFLYTQGDANPSPDFDFTGGIIVTDDANFINNRVALKFWKYDYANSYSLIKNTNFETNDNLLPGTNPKTYIIIEEVDGVDIFASNFTDDHAVSSAIKLVTGIETFDAKFKVTSYNGTPSYFNNLKDGIRALAFDPLKFPQITNNQFYDNLRSVYISGVDGAEVTENEFFYWEGTVPSGEPSYCMYLDYCTGYTIEENDFTYNMQQSEYPTGIGLVVNNSGGDPNEIYRNNFYDLEYGILAQENNRNKVGYGLILKCNTYEGTTMDKCITWPGPFVTSTSGIAEYQGASSTDPEDMAGNLFQIDGQAANSDFDDILNEGNSLVYYYPQNNNNDRVIPVDYTQNTVTIEDEFITPNNWTYENGCPPSEEPGGGGISDTRDKMASAGQKVDSTENLLAMLIDGGNTEATQTEVETSIPPETMQVYNDLMNKSPYLSDTVVSTAIEKEDVLPGAMIRDIMVANPKAAKSAELMNKLDERYAPLPEYMKAQILAGRSIVSIREETESRLAAFKLERAEHFNNLVRYYLTDTVNPSASVDSLDILLQNENSLNAKYKLAMLKAKQVAWSEGLAIMNNIPAQFELNTAEAEAHSQFTSYYTLLSGMAQQGKSIIEADSTEIPMLYNMETSQSGIASVYARNILLCLGLMEYEEPIILPDLLKSSAAMNDYNKLLSKANDAPGYIKVQPNPAKDYIIVEYEFEQETVATVEINNISGISEYSKNTTGKQDQHIVDTRNWNAGIYIVSLKINGKLIESVKFTVID